MPAQTPLIKKIQTNNSRQLIAGSNVSRWRRYAIITPLHTPDPRQINSGKYGEEMTGFERY